MAAPCEVDEEESFYEEHKAVLLQEMKNYGAERLSLRPASCGVGLLNQGATCYMNSLLQALFYTPEFRVALYDWHYDAAAHGSADRSIPLQLQRLFAEMQLSTVSAASTRAFTAACGMSDTGTQHDVQELCRVLFDALSQSSKPLAEKINGLFSGKLEHYIRCAEETGGDGPAPESRREEVFFDLQVQIQGCTSLEQALRQLVEPEILDGDNQWFCEALGRKVDAKKGVSLQSLPPILCLQLMRFIFDLVTMSRRKLNELVAIPLELDLAFLFEPGSAPANTKYALSAVCLHSGTTHSGHYRAYVQDETAAGQWFEANDAVVKVMDEHQRDRLFKLPSDDSEASSGNAVRIFNSSEAYFLVYRRVDGEAPHIDTNTVPEPVRSECLSRNASVAGLQRAYAVHKRMVELKVYSPKASYIALRKHSVQNLSGLLATEDEEANVDEALQSVTVNVHTARPVRHAMHKAIEAFAVEGNSCDSQEAASWASELSARLQAGEVRLRRYDQWTGESKEPLEGAALDNAVEQIVSRFTGQLQGSLILELRDAGQDFDPWHEDAGRVVVCRWDHGRGAIDVGPGSLQALRVPLRGGEGGDAQQAETAVAPVEPEAEAAAAAPPAEPEEEMPDLFADSAPTVKQGPQRDTSPVLGDVRAAVAANMGVDVVSLALVPLTGAAAGEPLGGDEGRTLWQCNVWNTDLLCAEVVVEGVPLGSVQLYDRVKNTATFSFNHPERPQYSEEFTVSCSKNATLAQLKELIAGELGVDASGIHLCRGPKAPQLKDETKSLRQAGIADSGGIFVGQGPPCGVDETMLRVSLYIPSEKGGPPRQRELFAHPGKGAGSVRSLRQALVAPLIRWHEKQSAAASPAANADGGDKPGSGNDLPPFSVEGLTWQRLRLRDGQAGKQFAVLRDDRTLRSALMGFSDLRQVAVQALDHDEELTAEDLFFTLRTWRVHEGKLSVPTEEIVRKTQTLAAFRAQLAARFGPELFLPAAAPEAPGEAGEEPEAEAEAGKGQGGAVKAEPAPEEFGEDFLQLFTLPTATTPNVMQRLQASKWEATRLNSANAVDAELPLSEFKELRDGVALVVRSARSAARGPPDIVNAGKGKGKGPKGPTATLADGIAAKAEGRAKGKAKSWPKVSVAAPAARRERGIVIQVANPEAAEGESAASKHGEGEQASEEAATAPPEPAAEPSPREPQHAVH